MKHHNESKINGFTLVEVLIASAILAVGLLAVSTMIAKSTIQDSRSYYMTKASMLAEEFFEQESYKQYTTKFGNLTDTTKSIIIDGISYERNCNVNNATPVEFCKEMTCSITWNNKGVVGETEYVYDFCRYTQE
ncbi:type IV pilus modification PilV family protein [Desulfomicrobium escambiense]|uniref:type IV pilus modification PilV family protein n=1 Tax=Desulfomicrobium escambiense TaxID=29503 RepID=UPI000A01BF4B|nr:prepilin-type N-terminal cleavage/methylation domain-containing protein [Desulfomicrobium escambiense]